MKMKAAVIRQMGADQPYAESRPMTIEEVEIESPQERELLIQIKAASLCHSDPVSYTHLTLPTILRV